MKKNLLLLLCFLLGTIASAQYYIPRNNVLAFGGGVGVDFTSGAPVSFTSSINTYEGCATVCNTVGQLLFYTDGRTVYNRLGAVTPSGATIVPFSTSSSSQGAVIVPFLNDTNKYYVFSMEAYGGSGRLAYSIVDMTLAGGLGDVSTAGVILTSGLSEKMIAVAGNNCNVWLLAHSNGTPHFISYEITASGISPTFTISSVGSFTGANCYAVGVMKCSPDRQKIVTASWPFASSSSGWGIELYNFNAATGIVSACQVLEANVASSMPYGAEFSPDNTKLYTTDHGVSQWDVSLPTTAAIIASKTPVYSIASTAYLFSDLRIGPDSKIYLNHDMFSTYIDRIDYPNLAGSACGYTALAINVSPASTIHGLPNIVWTQNPILGASTLCTGMTSTLSTSVAGGTWSSGNPAVATISSTGVVTAVAPGSAAITYTTGGSCGGSTVITVVSAPTVPPTGLCIGASAVLTASTGSGIWSSSSTAIATVGSATGVISGLSSGTTIITYSKPGCPDATTVVTVSTMLPVTAGAVCVGSTTTASSTVAGGTWTSSSPVTANIASSSGVITGMSPGTALISYTSTGCLSTAIVTVTPLPTITGGSVCVGATLSLSSSVAGGTWSSGSSSTATVGPSGIVTGVASGTVAITYSPTGCSATTVVTVNPLTVFPGSSICAGSTLALAGSTAGGTWSSSNISVATVGISSGLVSGIAAGTAVITYFNPVGCPEITTVTVNALPGPIAGKLSLCETFSTMLNCSPGGGTWSSSSSNVTISSTGLATGVTSGTATITYMLPGGCYSTAIMSVNPLPAAIAGPTTVIQGATITLTNVTPGGSWSSGDTTKVSVNSGGVVTGVAPGTATVYYTLPTGCKASVVITVTSKNTVTVSSNIITKPTLYPNPATNEITIKVDGTVFTSLSIYNAVGQEVITRDIAGPEMKMNIKLLPPGEYQVIFKGDGVRDILRFTRW